MSDTALIHDLMESYQDILDAAHSLSNLVNAESTEFPRYIPTQALLETNPNASLDAAIDSMCRIHFQSTKDSDYSGTVDFHAGLVCASPGTIEQAVTLNNAKTQFKACVKALNVHHKKHRGSIPAIPTLIANEVTDRGYRSQHLKKALAQISASRVNLKRAYAHVRIMPIDTDSMSWTWQTGHSTIKTISVSDALQLASALTPPANDIAIKQLNTCHIDDILAIKKSLPNQLRANYTFMDDSVRVRKSTPLSGVVLAQQDYLPRLMWRDKPDSNSIRRLASPQARYEPEPFITSLNLYRPTSSR